MSIIILPREDSLGERLGRALGEGLQLWAQQRLIELAHEREMAHQRQLLKIAHEQRLQEMAYKQYLQKTCRNKPISRKTTIVKPSYTETNTSLYFASTSIVAIAILILCIAKFHCLKTKQRKLHDT